MARKANGAPRSRHVELQFPLAGIDRSRAIQWQTPFTTPAANNVQPKGVVEGRERGGSRPGTMDHAFVASRSSPINLMAPLDFVYDGGYINKQWDLRTLKTGTLPREWTEVSGVKEHLSWPKGISRLSAVGVGGPANPYVWKHEISGLDNTAEYWICVRAIMSAGAVVTIYAENDTALAGDCVWVFTMGGTTPFDVVVTDPAANTTTASNVAPVGKPVWLAVKVNGANSYGYVDGVSIDSDNSWTGAGDFWGVGVGHATTLNYATVDKVWLAYTPTTTTDLVVQTQVYGHNGSLYYQKQDDPMVAAQVGSTVSISSKTRLQATPYQGKLYIADYDDPVYDIGDGNGSIDLNGATWEFDIAGVDFTTLGLDIEDHVIRAGSEDDIDEGVIFRIATITAAKLTLVDDNIPAIYNGVVSGGTIERCPKFYDPEAATPITKSTYANVSYPVPIGAQLIATFNGRMVYARSKRYPFKWWMSNVGSPTLFDYGGALSDIDDPQRAFADVDGIGEQGLPISAIAAYHDSYMLLWNESATWVLDDDPHLGGTLRAVSRVHGCVGSNAWCFGPSGECYFLSAKGLVVMPPGGERFSVPVLVSKGRIPDELIGCDDQTVLVYDDESGGVRICTTYQGYWFWHRSTQSWWSWSHPVVSDDWFVSHAMTLPSGGVVLGYENGQLRNLDEASEYDDDLGITSEVTFGPMKAGEQVYDGVVNALDITLGEDTEGSVTWMVWPVDSGEAAADAADGDASVAFATGTVAAGRSPTVRPRMRGFAWALMFQGSRQWTYEGCQAQLQTRGRHRAI